MKYHFTWKGGGGGGCCYAGAVRDSLMPTPKIKIVSLTLSFATKLKKYPRYKLCVRLNTFLTEN